MTGSDQNDAPLFVGVDRLDSIEQRLLRIWQILFFICVTFNYM